MYKTPGPYRKIVKEYRPERSEGQGKNGNGKKYTSIEESKARRNKTCGNITAGCHHQNV